jgi:ubiquitin-protein ligase
MSRSQKAINNQFQKYLQLKETIPKETDWIRDYGYYLFRDKTKIDHWFGLVVGPDDSLYTGVMLFVRISFPSDFPFSPPKIENLLPFPRQFNANLWSVDTVQSLMCSDGEYRPFYGLICMDILNTPHSKIETNVYGEPHEVYDKSKEQYTPIINISSIMMSLRSNILSGETKLPHLSEQEIKFLTLRYLTFGVMDHQYKLKTTEDGAPRQELEGVACQVFALYQKHYQKVIGDLIESGKFKEETAELNSLYKRFATGGT